MDNIITHITDFVRLHEMWAAPQQVQQGYPQTQQPMISGQAGFAAVSSVPPGVMVYQAPDTQIRLELPGQGFNGVLYEMPSTNTS